jgi:CMP-N,N'-diacetyllegionaminic acid synthase
MGDSMSVICTICARGGSVGVKNKNIRRLRNKPLLAHTIIQAQNSNLFDKIVVSSDSKKIRDIALEWGAHYVVDRPDHLATSAAPKIPVIQHACLEAEQFFNKQFNVLVDLDVTSPLRHVDDILNAYKMFVNDNDASNLVTAMPARRSPYFNMLEVNAKGYTQLVKTPHSEIHRRQDAPSCYDMNASIYIWKRETLFNSETTIREKTLLYVMPEERSIDIDSMLDWEFVKLLARSRKDL